MANFELGPADRRLLARFVLRGTADGHRGHMPVPAGDYVAETRVLGDDLEISMFARDEDAVRELRLAMMDVVIWGEPA